MAAASGASSLATGFGSSAISQLSLWSTVAGFVLLMLPKSLSSGGGQGTRKAQK